MSIRCYGHLKLDRGNEHQLLRTTEALSRDAPASPYPHRMLMVLADGKPFRAGPWRRKRSATAMLFLDDASRFALGIVVETGHPIRASPAAV